MKHLLLASAILATAMASNRSFVIDYENDTFLKDGEPFRFISGAIYYFRLPKESWRDRLTKLKAAGLNTVETYIEWSTHEPESGKFVDVDDITDYIKMAQELGLHVILRPGPYICAERDMGGFPYWLTSEDPDMKLRTSHPTYLKFVDRWFKVLLTAVRPFLYSNGGPVILVQVENEYGFYDACDFSYMAWMRDTMRKYLVEDVVLFTVDTFTDDAMKCGKVSGVYTTVDFGTNVEPEVAFAVQRRHQERGPLVNSEFYMGWIDHWAEPHHVVPMDAIIKAFDKQLSMGANVNMFMFHGGSSFGFKAGANFALEPSDTYQADLTTYDYDAPLTEAGDPTEKYFAVRDLLSKYVQLPDMPLAVAQPKMAIGPVKMARHSDFEFTRHLYATEPMTFEKLGEPEIYVKYWTTVDFKTPDPVLLSVPGLRDRGQVFVDDRYVGTLSRTEKIYSMPIAINSGSKLSILVENQGRINFGPLIGEQKGITGNVTLGKVTLKGWHHDYQLKSQVDLAHSKPTVEDKPQLPAVFVGSFELQMAPLDTYLRLDGWGKGVAYVNGFNLGRYWPDQGPQVTLYVPKNIFKPNEPNVIVLFETQSVPAGDDCVIQFVNEPKINGSVPY
ncbi:Beta-galactosidase [Halotydeus destructor]|nr:Beta-galactosidase [Halotydeus destructor]